MMIMKILRVNLGLWALPNDDHENFEDSCCFQTFNLPALSSLVISEMRRYLSPLALLNYGHVNCTEDDDLERSLESLGLSEG